MPDKNELHRIFDNAVEIDSPHERQIYLDQACGDARLLREEVASLLEAADAAQNFLEAPLFDPSQLEKIGTKIGPYKLCECIGEGGMGIVYIAEPPAPDTNKVALKIIKPGMDTKQVLARFEAERQVLSFMDHPNIAKVRDAGATTNGHPYFVMELVRGLPIVEYCDKHGRTVHQRLNLFIHVCSAVQHAHQKGIIHRDIKPGNVLVARDGNREIPKVIDFGVAKATQQPFSDLGVYTNFHQIVGTPLYMSPEQSDPTELDIDMRSDVYSLGVVLYELLTGTTPISIKRAESIGFDEIRRIIREEEPVRPSERVSTLSAASSETVKPAAFRSRKLGRNLAGDLDWIVMKALEKDRDRRYESASDLATDIQRYLNNEPVLARAPSASYRFRKLVRRHQTFLTVACLFLLTLLVGIAGTIHQAIRATQERDQKVAALQKAESHLELARKTIDELHRQIDLENRSVLSQNESSIRNTIDLSYEVASSLERGSQKLAAEFEFDRIADLHHALGEDEQAAEALKESLKIQADLLYDDPENQQQLHNATTANGKLAIAEMSSFNFDHATTAIEKGRELLREIVDGETAELKLPLALFPIVEAGLKICQGEFEDADRLAIEAENAAKSLNEKKGRLDLAFVVQSAQTLRAMSLTASGRFDAAKSIADKSLEKCEQLIEQGHSDSENLKRLVASWCVIQHEIAWENGQLVEACDYLRRGLLACPDDAEANYCMAWMLSTCSESTLRDPEAAVKYARMALEIHSDEPEYYNALGVALYRAQKYAESIIALEKFKEITGERDGPNGFFLAMAYHQSGLSNIARERFQEADKWTESSVEEMSSRDRDNVQRFRAEAEAMIGVPDE